MLSNRITSHFAALEESAVFGESTSQPNLGTNPLAPPSNFAPVPENLLGGVSKDHLAWQQDLYRMAYQSALAAVAAQSLRRAQMN